MSNHRESYIELKVGIFTLFGLLILIFIIISIGDFHIYQKGYKINILFNKVEGLEIASPIRLSGMEVGEVKEMLVDNNKIRVVVWIKNNVPIRADSKITINSLGIIGEKYIEITRGSPSARLLNNEDTIVGIDPVSVGSLLYKAEGVILNLERATGRIEEMLQGSVKKIDIHKIVKTTLDILNNINTIIKENKQNIKKTFVDLDESSIALVRAAEIASISIKNIEKNVDTLIKDTDTLIKDNVGNIKIACTKFKDTSILLNEKVSNISVNLEKVTSSINQIIDKNEGSLNVTLENYRKSSLEFVKIANSLKNIVDKIEKGQGLLGKISSDDKVAASLDDIIQNLNEFSEDIKKHPWKLLKK